MKTIILCPSLFLLLLCGLVHAQVSDDGAAISQLPDQIAQEFRDQLSEIALHESEVESLTTRLAASEGPIAEILATRLDRVWAELFTSTVSLADRIADQRETGHDVSAYVDPVVESLEAQVASAYRMIERKISQVRFPDETLPPQEFAVNDQKLFQYIHALDELYGALVEYVALADRYGLDASEAREFATTSLSDSAANRSAFLEMAIADVEVLRATASTLPDSTELAQWLRATETRVQLTAEILQETVSLMDALGLDTRVYRKQILTATGEITADVLDVGIIATLVSEWSQRVTALVATDGPKIGFRFLLIVLIMVAAIYVAKLARQGTERALNSKRVHVTNLLRRLIIATAGNIVMLLGILLAIGQFGISLGPILAGLGIAGFIVGFALQDTLSNFASGIMILLYRPFDVGDVVDAGGVLGKVSHMSLVNTTFMTLDNQTLIVPNNLIWGAVITNVTAQRTRRIDLQFDVSYDDDLDKVERVLHEVVESHEAVLDDPETVIRLHALGESSVQFIVRPWVLTDDYWDTYWDLLKAVKKRFDEEGIQIPYPHRTLQVIQKEQSDE